MTDAQAGGGTLDYETPLEIDPDALAVGLQGEFSAISSTPRGSTLAG